MPFTAPNDGIVFDVPVFTDQWGRPAPAPTGTSTWTPGDSTVATLVASTTGAPSATITPVSGTTGSYSYSFAITDSAGASIVYTEVIDFIAPIATAVAANPAVEAPPAAPAAPAAS